MIQNGLNQFKDKNILLLQGPIGPFFKNFAKDLKNVNATVHKINFNGGDCLFYRSGICFNQPIDNFPQFLTHIIQTHKIDIVFLFGDCRPVHKIAHAVLAEMGIEIGVFEEGYIRPDFITLEKHGVNAHSQMSRSISFYTHLTDITKKDAKIIGKSFWYATLWGMMYYTACHATCLFFRHYQHHRTINIWQGLYWIRALWRKWIFSFQQHTVLEKLTRSLSKKYYFVPLQVHNDAQIHYHSDFNSIEEFIKIVIESFELNANTDCHLVIKHHPMDRGFNHYGELIDQLCADETLRSRIHYVHDLHLPTLLTHTKGVIVINSTVGLQALDHNCPVITCGSAIYNMVGLTYQGSLDDYWEDSKKYLLNKLVFENFVNHLIHTTQINGNFYKRFLDTSNHTGVFW